MRRGKVAAIWSVLAFLFVGSGLLASIAWFNSGRNEVDVDVNGSVVEEYFHCGNGTEGNPYVITRPIHYYHLVEFFQRTTTLEIDGVTFGTDYLYFQVGYDLDGNASNGLEVYEYDDQGIYTGTSDSSSASTSGSGLRTSKTLNMAYYSGTNALMPIGTNEVPFIGSFDGKADEGISISNLNIHCAETVYIDNSPVNRAASDIGIFGYVADEDSGNTPTVIKNARFNGLTIDLTDVTSTVASSGTAVAHEATHDGEAYVGLIAGHVHTYTNYSNKVNPATDAAPLSHVYVSNASIEGGAGVRCNYGYIGKVDTIDANTPATTVAGEVSALNNGTGTGNRFGGSIDMMSLHDRLRRIYNGPAVDNGSYDSITYDYDSGSLTEGGKIENLNNHFSNYSGEDYSYTFNKHDQGNQEFYYLYGDLNNAAGGTRTSTTHYYQSTSISSTGFTLRQEKNQYYFSATKNNTTYYLCIPQRAKTFTSIEISNNDGFVTQNEGEKTLFEMSSTSDGYVLIFCRMTISGTNYLLQLALNNAVFTVYLRSGGLYSTQTYCWKENASGYWMTKKSTSYCLRLNINNNTTRWKGSTSSSDTQANDFSVSKKDYLKADGISSTLSLTGESSEATTWLFSGNNIFSVINVDGKKYLFYLNGSSSGLTISRLTSSSSATSWSTGWSNNQLALSFVESGTTYYLSLSTSSLISASSVTTIRSSVGTITESAYEYSSSEAGTPETFPSSSFPATHIPLSVQNSQNSSSLFTTSSFNTGYIMSGKAEHGIHDNNDSEVSRYRAGDVRVSRYDIANIQSATGQTSYDDAKLFAITATDNSNYALITDEHNKNSTAPSALSGVSARKASTTLSRYNDWKENEDDTESIKGARDSMGTVFTSGGGNIYGLHFMNATIGKNNIVNVPKAVINGEIHSNGLDMLGDCIDFHVKQKGYIVFFAGTYFNVGGDTENECFFSLYKVNRNQNNSLDNPTLINAIYQDGSGNFYYNLNNPGSSYTKVFDTSVLTAPTTFINNAVYYFEIPVDAGEYALGSVSGKNGAYLMYLDISASGSETTGNAEHKIDDVPLFTQIDFQTDTFVTNSCFNVAYVIPNGSNKGNFSISISCGTVTYQGSSYTCYEIEINNTSGNNFVINCLLMDNDNDPNNAYYYMYAIKYNTGTRTQYFGSNTFTGTSSGTSMTPTYTIPT